MQKSRPWTREELLKAIRLYCVTPFGRMHSKNPAIVSLAGTLDRTSSALALKLVNFASLDETIERRGMSHASKLDEEVWKDFFSHLTNGEIGLDQNQTHGFAEAGQAGYQADQRMGIDTPTISKRRVNQDFFRSLILASYEERCAMTGIADSMLLVASHIDPWASNHENRLNPRNGLCLNNLHDQAFERGLITVAPDLSIVFSSRLASEDREKLQSITQPKLTLPKRFRPDPDLLEKHRQTRFLT